MKYKSRRGIGRLVQVGIGVVALVAVLAVAGTLVGTQNISSGNTTPSSSTSHSSSASSSSSLSSSASTTSSASSTTASTAPSTSSSTAISNPVTIAVTAAILDTFDSPSGYTTYIYDVTLTNLDSVTHFVSAFDFKLISSTNAVYDLSIALAVRQLLPSVDLSPNQHVSGQISFQVTSGDQPAKLEFTPAFDFVAKFVTGLPQPTIWASRVGLFANVVFQGNQTNAYTTVASVQNSTDIFYTGELIAVKIAVFSYSPQASTISISSVTVSNEGFSVSKVSPALPIIVMATTTETDFVVYVVAPKASVDLSSLQLTLVAG